MCSISKNELSQSYPSVLVTEIDRDNSERDWQHGKCQKILQFWETCSRTYEQLKYRLNNSQL